MADDSQSRHWLQTLPGLLTALAGLIGAVTALLVALHGNGKEPDMAASSKPELVKQAQASTSPPAPSAADQCQTPYVWRLAVPSDHVCVTVLSHQRVELENQRAAERRQAGGGVSGADTCLVGYVWREAFDGDTVCVLPERRQEVRAENAAALRNRTP